MAVVISGVSGSTHGSPITITGTGFGTHADYGGSESFLNAVWNDFSVGLDDGNIARSGQVNAAMKWTLQTTGARGGAATQFARKRYDTANTGGIGRLGSLEHVPSGSGSVIYTSFWFKTADVNVMTGGKFYRNYFNSFDYYLSLGPEGGDEEGFITANSTQGASGIFGSAQGAVLDPGETWRFVEVTVFLNGGTALFGSDDYIEWRVNRTRVNRRGSGLASNHIAAEGSISNEQQNWVGGSSGDADGHTIDVGMMIDDGTENGGAGDETLSWYDYSDVYIDYTIARVMVGSASTFAANTGFEMQIPTSWDAGGTSITVTGNRGALSALTGNYVYVVASDGSVNANGFQIGSAGVVQTRSPRLRRLVRKVS